MDNTAENQPIMELTIEELEGVSGGIPWLVIPLVAIATHLASEYYHHHM